MIKLILACILNFLLFTSILGQVIQDTTKKSNTILYEKLYLHTDREVYSPGNDIWFKSYLVSGINNKLIPGNKNIYVQLINENGEIVDSLLMLSNFGVANNDFHLSDSLSPGSYIIRAHTKYQQNFGEESLFHKKIQIAKADDFYESRNNNKTQDNNINISFLPEGGNLVLNAANHIAFKAINEKGRGINVSGKVIDESGELVTAFQTSYKGMGRFIMMPQEGKTYSVKLDDHPDFSFRFEEAKIDGIAINYQPKGNNLLFTINRNIMLNDTLNLNLIGSYKGKVLFSNKLEMTGFQKQVEVFKGNFPLGISKITLVDDAQDILAERLVFVRNADVETLQIKTDKNQYATRGKALIDITSMLDEDDTISNTLSVAIVNEDYFDAGGISQTIESYLLLDSELKGPIESPASCFVDEEDITADEKLDLVMLVNGWRRYYWDDITNSATEKLPDWDDIGLEMSGWVKRLFGEKPVDEGIVKLGPFSGSFIILKDTTDNQGRFSFENIYLKDSAKIMLNATTKAGRSAVEIYYEPTPLFDSKFVPKEIGGNNFDIIIPDKFYRGDYYRQLAEKEFKLESESILLGDVDIYGDDRTRDGHVRIYGTPSRSIQITEDDWTYSSILEYLEDNGVAGVIVTGDEVRIRGASGNPLLLVDGIKTDWDVILYLSIADVDKIEILKDSYYTAIFGSEGGNGIISVLTRTGEGAFQNEFVRNVKGRITPTVFGFRQAREFYSPEYSLNTLDKLNERKPDFRPTLYWSPHVYLKQGTTELEIFTSDMLGRYRVVTEGISEKGTICFGTVLFEVGTPDK